MNSSATPFRVGLLVLVSATFLFVFVTFAKKGSLSARSSIEVYAYFRDASGLGPKSRVQVAGIPVGQITSVRLEGTRAKVHLRLRQDLGVRTDAELTKRSESLLGDFLLDLTPGSPEAPLLEDGGEIRKVNDQQGMEALFESLRGIAGDIQAVTASVRQVLGSDEGERSLQRIVDNLVRVTGSLDQTAQLSADRLAVILANVERISAEVRELTVGERAQVERIIENVAAASADIAALTASFRGTGPGQGGSGEGELAEGTAGVSAALERLNNTLRNLEEVTDKVRRGEGALGKLVADDHLGRRVGESLESVTEFADKLAEIQTEVGVRSEYLMAQGSARNSLALKLTTKPDKYYLVELVDDPRGFVETQVITNNPPSTGEPATQVQRITKDAVKVSAQFAKRYYFGTLRFGLTESTGGIGADLHLFRDALTFKLDAFDFSVQELRFPRLRASVRFTPFHHVFVTAGVDDALNRQVRDAYTNQLLAGRDFFLGAGLFFTDDDLKAVLTTATVVTPR